MPIVEEKAKHVTVNFPSRQLHKYSIEVINKEFAEGLVRQPISVGWGREVEAICSYPSRRYCCDGTAAMRKQVRARGEYLL